MTRTHLHTQRGLDSSRSRAETSEQGPQRPESAATVRNPVRPAERKRCMQAQEPPGKHKGRRGWGLRSVEGEQGLHATQATLPNPPRIPQRRHCKHLPGLRAPGNEKHNRTTATDPGMKPQTRVQAARLQQTATEHSRGQQLQAHQHGTATRQSQRSTSNSRSILLSHTTLSCRKHPNRSNTGGSFPWGATNRQEIRPGPQRPPAAWRHVLFPDNPMTPVPAPPEEAGPVREGGVPVKRGTQRSISPRGYSGSALGAEGTGLCDPSPLGRPPEASEPCPSLDPQNLPPQRDGRDPHPGRPRRVPKHSPRRNQTDWGVLKERWGSKRQTWTVSSAGRKPHNGLPPPKTSGRVPGVRNGWVSKSRGTGSNRVGQAGEHSTVLGACRPRTPQPQGDWGKGGGGRETQRAEHGRHQLSRS
ncbi:hypothetical protein CRENBAI_005580 [Crenichthys baileyi]|uniref:Uncharacterized protein n=1 Tax=Crenichthys baileyi TaxID=28760 RepID=A0AAV9SF35_9TELE